MTELELYKFINDNNIEYHSDKDSWFIILPLYLIEDFSKMLPVQFFDDGGRRITLFNDYVAIDMENVLDYFGIDGKNIFKGESNK